MGRLGNPTTTAAASLLALAKRRVFPVSQVHALIAIKRNAKFPALVIGEPEPK
jgi:hypothetical protein